MFFLCDHVSTLFLVCCILTLFLFFQLQLLLPLLYQSHIWFSLMSNIQVYKFCKCTGHKCKPWLSRHGGNSISGSSVDQKVQIPCLQRIHCIFGLALIFFFFFFFFFSIPCWIILQNYARTWKSTQQSQFMELLCAFVWCNTLSTFQ